MAAHIVVALIALVVIGGATRVMEAGLACPDWPLCYGSFFPKGRMNLQIFLEWFHRLDAFFIGIAITLQFLFSLIYRSSLPKWLPILNGFLFLLIILQGALGALTVIDLLPSTVVTMHLLLALTIVALMSAVSQVLLSENVVDTPFWWKFLSGISLLTVFAQSLLGGRMATTWSAQRCFSEEVGCNLLFMHKLTVLPVVISVLLFVGTAFYMGGWFRSQWPLFLSVIFLLTMQIFIGFSSIHLASMEPLTRISHQLIASLLVAFLSALSCRKPMGFNFESTVSKEDSSLEVCHG